jgi:glutamate N-acetyltransferase / amino-acid N-acetyltransferase
MTAASPPSPPSPPGPPGSFASSALPPVLPAVEGRAAIPLGFVAGATAVGIKASGRPDLAVIATTRGPDGRRPASAAAVFTPNAFAAAPVLLSRTHLAASRRTEAGRLGLEGADAGWCDGIVVTSGCANAATGIAGDEDQAAVADALAAALETRRDRTLLMSTGVIGVRLPLDRVLPGIAALVGQGLSAEDRDLEAVSIAMRTTDSRTKAATVALELPDAEGRPVPVRVSGIAKGVGMIHPRMATMLAVVLTDAAADPTLLRSILRPAAARTWNQLSIDGDTSTNDTAFLLASGAAGAAPVAARSPEALMLGRAVEAVARDLARQQAADGEGATTLITSQVDEARDDADARAIARAVVASSLVKAAIHGRDPNWGRIVAAAGNARLADAEVLEAAGLQPGEASQRAGRPAAIDPDRLQVAIAGTPVFDGTSDGPLPFDREAVRAAMDAPEVVVRLTVGLGTGTGEAFGCDLTEEYVRENAEYTT